MAGKFIALEGIDSEVLTDQAKLLAGWLREQNLPVVTTREPTDGPIGAQIHLVQSGRLEVDEFTQAALFLADRMDHLYREEDGILRELETGRHVVCVRYLLSAYAYQSEAAGFEWLKQINQPCPWPDLMILIDTPVQNSLDRFVKREGYDDERAEMKRAELTKHRHDYLQAFERCKLDDELDRGNPVGAKLVKVDGGQSGDAIHRQCRDMMDRVVWRQSA